MKMKKLITSAVTFYLFIILGAHLAEAGRLLPRYKGSGDAAKRGVSSGVVISPRLRADRRALLLYFANINKAKGITYTLIYQTNGKDEGVSGSINSSVSNSATRELLFGTCSSGVCRYHANISNMRLEVVSELSSGKKLLRRFRVRV